MSIREDAPHEQKMLLLRMANGDEQAFTSFVQKHTGNIYSYILRITKSEEWAEELVQDVWVQVWHAREQFAALDNPLGYLHRMAQHRTLDWLRKHKRALKAQYLIHQQFSVECVNSLEEKTDYEHTKRILDKAIAQLPPQRKRIFELRQQHLNYDQIAATLMISKNTVRNQMVSALHTLREYLQTHQIILFLFFF